MVELHRALATAAYVVGRLPDGDRRERWHDREEEEEQDEAPPTDVASETNHRGIVNDQETGQGDGPKEKEQPHSLRATAQRSGA